MCFIVMLLCEADLLVMLACSCGNCVSRINTSIQATRTDGYRLHGRYSTDSPQKSASSKCSKIKTQISTTMWPRILVIGITRLEPLCWYHGSTNLPVVLESVSRELRSTLNSKTPLKRVFLLVNAKVLKSQEKIN